MFLSVIIIFITSIVFFGTQQTAFADLEVLFLRDTSNNGFSCASNVNKDMDPSFGSYAKIIELDANEYWWYGPSYADTTQIPAGPWKAVYDTTTLGGGGPPGKVTVRILVVDTTTCAISREITPAGGEEQTMDKGTNKEYETTPVNHGSFDINPNERIVVSFEKTGGDRGIYLRYDSSGALEDSFLEFPAVQPPPPPTELSWSQNEIPDRHSAWVRYYDPLEAGNGPSPDILVNVNSTIDPTGFTVPLGETLDDGHFISYRLIQFMTTSQSNPDPVQPGLPYVLQVEMNANANVTYNSQISTSNIILDGSPITYADRRGDGNWSTCPDDDLDGLCNEWEINTGSNQGLVINYPSTSGIQNYTYPCDPLCPDPQIKDVYIEIDYMDGHKPNEDAINDVIETFLNSPVDGGKGIQLHIQWGDNNSDVLGHKSETPFPGSNSAGSEGFDQIKAVYFGTPQERQNPDWDSTVWKQKKQAFHYALFVHKQAGNTASGAGELLGNDFMLSLGPFTGEVGSRDQQAGTFLHEIGHNINLNHGGAPSDTANCKPNYLSVMSYSRQFTDLLQNRTLDFSHKNLNTTLAGSVGLVENNLIELDGVGSALPEYTTEQKIIFGTPSLVPFGSTGGPVDWNNDGTIETSPQSLDVNYINDPAGNPVCLPTTTEHLLGHNDWDNIDLISAGTGNWLDGRMSSPCKTGNADSNGQCRGGQGMGQNERSSWYPQLANRNFVSGIDEITKDDVVSMRLIRINAVENIILNLHPSHFHDPDFHNDIKSKYSAQFDTIRDHIRNDRLIAAMEVLDNIRRTFDGKNAGEGNAPGKYRDLITNAHSQAILRDHLDGITISYHNARDHKPTLVHDEPASCSKLTSSTDGITYDIPYCIHNGHVVKTTFDDKPGRSLFVTIDANDEGFVKLDMKKIISQTGPIKDDFISSINNNKVIHDEAQKDDRRYVTVPFTAGTADIKIGLGPDTSKPIDIMIIVGAIIAAALGIGIFTFWRRSILKTSP